MFNSVRLTALGVLFTLIGAVVGTVPTTLSAPADAAASRPGARPAVASRAVVLDVENTNATPVLCVPDDRSYQVRARLVGPRRVLEGRSGAIRVNVLVHDLGTGSWFWSLPRHRSFDYARQLARQGETSLV